MSQDKTPALTWEEWRASAYLSGGIVANWQMAESDREWLILETDDEERLSRPQRHALAALCLYQQPFGFTQDDVRLLKDFAAAHREWPNEKQIDFASKLESIATRIANLLPPKDLQAPPSP